jgi:hypothetical protein
MTEQFTIYSNTITFPPSNSPIKQALNPVFPFKLSTVATGEKGCATLLQMEYISDAGKHHKTGVGMCSE